MPERGLVPLRSSVLERASHVVHGFFDRHGGASAAPFHSLNVGAKVGDDAGCVTDNRARVARALLRDAPGLVFAEQVHGTNACEVTAPPTRAPQADILVTAAADVTLALYTADCVPILLAAPSAVAVAHAGWRGTAADVAGQAVEALCRCANASPEALSAALGPAIGPCCFEVDDDVSAALTRRAGGTGVRATSARRARIDLWAINETLLRHSGVAHVQSERICTMCSPAYFSHRREQGRTGRQAAAIGLLARSA